MPCLIDFCLVLIVGYAVTFCAGPRSRLERFAFAACLGPALHALALIYLSMLGHRPTIPLELLVTAAFATLGIACWTAHRRAQRNPQNPQSVSPRSPLPSLSSPKKLTRPQLWYCFLCLILIAYPIFIFAADVWIYPTTEWDAYAIWQLKAKVLAIHALHPIPSYFYEPTLSYSHLRYPLLVPMISAAVHVLAGTITDELARTPFFLMYLGMAAAIFATLRDRAGIIPAITVTALALNLPTEYHYAPTGTAELALTALYACSLVALLRWQQRARLGDLALLTLSSAALAWTKNEGAALAAVNAFALLFLSPRPFSRRNLAAAAVFAIVVIALYLPWLTFIRTLPRTDEDYAGHLTLHQVLLHVDRLPIIFRGLGDELISWSDYTVFWLLPPALALLQGRRLFHRTILTLWIVLILDIAIYIPPMMVSTWHINELIPVVMARLLMHAVPAAALLIGLQWPTTQAQPSNSTSR